MKENTKPLMVTIRCITFNHAPYIRQCLDGFVKQNTNFRFEAIVHDDASTDGTTEIVNEYAEKYPDIIKPILETENQYSKGGFSLINKIMSEHYPYGKYIAECEGDDYWVDPLKLQKQVDFLEAHPEFSMIHSRFNYYYQNSNTLKSDDKEYDNNVSIIQNNKDIGFNILDNNKYRIQTVTVLFRRECYDKISNNMMKESDLFLMGDTQLWIYLLSVGKVHFMEDVTSVYRILDESASHSKNLAKHALMAMSVAEMHYYYAKKFNYNPAYFYKQYLRALFRYRLIDNTYNTNTLILNENNKGFLYNLIDNQIFMSFCKMLWNVKRKMKYMKMFTNSTK